MPQSILATTLELSPKVVSAISETQKVSGVLSSVARTARLVDGGWIPELVTQLPLIKQGFGFFGKSIEKPIEALTHKAFSYGLKIEITKQLMKAEHSVIRSSVIKSAVVSVVSYLPSWAQEIASVASPLVEMMNDAAVERLTVNMLESLDPLINAPMAVLLAKKTSYLATESAKMYVGHEVQCMVIAYLAEQFKGTEYTAIGTTLEYAKQADDYRVILGLFSLMLATNLLPYVYEKLSYVSEKDNIKSKLKTYVLEKSNIDTASYTGKIYCIALDAMLDQLINSKMIDINQVKIALASLQMVEPALSYYNK